MATKDDIRNMATQSDISRLVTKAEFEQAFARLYQYLLFGSLSVASLIIAASKLL